MEPSSNYSYTLLKTANEIRLIYLLPGQNSSPISFDIFHAWGSKDDAHQAVIGSAKIAVSSNLHEALQHLRSSQHKRTLWIDALCIDQNNDKERSQQIRLMRDVYRTASQVIIWLGPDCASSDRALKFLEFLSKLGDGQPDMLSILESNGDWDALDELFARPWWSRAWVLQEAWSAANAILQCGPSIIPWNNIERASSHMARWNNTDHWTREIPFGLQHVNPDQLRSWEPTKRRYGLALHLACGESKSFTFLDLLWNTWDREAANPRDKIYSILGVARNELIPRIIPDYSKPMEQVYKEVARSIIMTEENLEILLAANGVAGTGMLPSWVPDWRTEANENRPTLLFNGSRAFNILSSLDKLETRRYRFLASGESKALFKFDDTLDTLIVSAMIFDRIASMTDEFRTCETWRLWGGIGRCRIATEALQQFREDVNAAYMLAAKSRGTPVDDQLSVTNSSLTRQVDEVLAAGYSGTLNYLYTGEDAYKYMYCATANIMRHRRFLVTEAGRFAIGDSVAQQGDYLCIIGGCNYPMILRQVDGHDYFRVVTHAYATLTYWASLEENQESDDPSHVESFKEEI
ncbi:heterokaryon incompatibility protein-domain-containing protein [Nemania abortiva]|nr:heterokaryon incompatibility protein-domain-containing protein [Nemania abortiva]